MGQALRMTWYLRKTYKIGITFRRPKRIDGQLSVWGSVDASYINGKGKSRIGITVSLDPNGTPILVISKKMGIGSGSSTDAELKGYNYAASILEWIRNIVKYVYLEEIGPSIIECDNKPSCLAIRKAWVTTKQLLADALTKPLGTKDYLRCRARLLGESRTTDDSNRELTLPNDKKIFTLEIENNSTFEVE